MALLNIEADARITSFNDERQKFCKCSIIFEKK